MITKYSTIIYAIKVWLFSVLTSPILMIVFGVVKNGQSLSEMLGVYAKFAIYGGILSLLSVFLFSIVVRFFAKDRKRRKNQQKVNIQIVATILCIAPFFMFPKEFRFFNLTEVIEIIAIIYLSTISFGIWFFDYKMPHHLNEKELLDHLKNIK